MNIPIRKIVYTFGLALLVSGALSAQDWRGRGRLQGQVTDEQGKGIANATVKLTERGPEGPGPEPIQADKHGRWSFLGLSGSDWTITIEADGYVTSEGSVKVNEFQANKPVVVEMRKNPYSSIDEGQALLEKGDYEAARAAFQKALPNLEEKYQAQLEALIADTYYQQKNYTEARSRYEAVLKKLAPEEQVHVLLRLGDSYLQEKEPAKARERYQQALPQVGNDGKVQLYLAIARTYDQEEQRPQAIEAVKKALEVAPDDAQSLQLIADLLSREGHDEEAQAYLAKLPDDTKLPPDMLLNLGIRYYNDQKLDEALGNFDKVVEQNPNMPEAYYYRGLVYLNQGNNDLARADFEKLIQLAPDSKQATEAKEFLTYLEPGSR